MSQHHPYPCPWLPRAAEGAKLSVLHWHRKIGAWARSTGSCRLVCTPTKGMSPASRFAHHRHKGAGNRIVCDGAGSGGCSTSPGRSALWLPMTQPRPPKHLCSLVACSVHVTCVCPPPSSSGLTASRLVQPLLVQHPCPMEAQGCRQGAGFVHDSSSYPCRGLSILHQLWPQQAVTVSCHWVQSLSPIHAAFSMLARVPARQSPLAPGAKWDRSPRHDRAGRAGCAGRWLEAATGSI